MKHSVLKLLLSFILLASSASHAASESFGDYTIHYQAVNSTFVDADIAAQYGIVRGDRRGFLNVSVVRQDGDGGMTPVPAAVSGGRRNLLGQVGEIPFREIREGSAIYYIGEFDFSNAETVRFTINVQPEGAAQSHEIRWETRIYDN